MPQNLSSAAVVIGTLRVKMQITVFNHIVKVRMAKVHSILLCNSFIINPLKMDASLSNPYNLLNIVTFGLVLYIC